VNKCKRVNEVDLHIYIYIFEPDLHQYVLMVCVSEKVVCNMTDCMYTHMYTLKHMYEYE